MPVRKRKKTRGPVEVVEGRGLKIPIYFSPVRGDESYQLAFYREGKRERERMATRVAARERAKVLIEELSSGLAHVGTFTPREVAVITEVIDILAPIKVPQTEAVRQFAEAHKQLDGKGSIADAVKCFLEQQQRIQLTPIRIPELVEKYLVRLREQQKSRRYTLDMQARLHKAAQAFTGFVTEIHATDINRWLAEMKHVEGRTKNNYRTALATLFSFARQEGYLPRGIQTEAEFSQRYDGRGGEIGIYKIGELRTLLFKIAPRFVPYVAIGAFAGLRSAEIVRLEWPEIRFSQDVIEVKAAKAKTATRRLVPIQPCLKAWLTAFKKDSGPVLRGIRDEFALATQFKKAVDEIGSDQESFKIVHNGLRHSFISYRMAVLKNAAEVALEAGNSPRMIFEHYRELVTEQEGRSWFNTQPTEARLKTIRSLESA